MNRIRAFEQISRSLRRAGIDFVVSHGIEGYPESVGRDLDLVVRSEDVERALDVAREELEAAGYVTAVPSRIWGPRLLALAPAEEFLLEVHFMKRLNWRNILLVDRPGRPMRTDPFPVDAWVSFAKGVLLPLLSSAERDLVDRAEAMGAAEWNAGVHSRVARSFGHRSARELEAALRSGRADKLTGLAPRLRRAGSLRAWIFKPVSSFRLTAASLVRRARQPFHPCAPVVALVGPDGAGKSTLIRLLEAGDRGIFTNVVLRHWRPGLLPALGRLAARNPAPPSEAESVAPRRSAGRFRIVRIAYYALDVLIGSWVLDRISTSRQQLVLYDRCFLDMAVDPLRYGLRDGIGVRLIWRWLPKPDLILLVDGDPEIVHGRKAELSIAEIRRQLCRWHDLVRAGAVDGVLRAEVPAADLVKEVRRRIARKTIEMNRTGQW